MSKLSFIGHTHQLSTLFYYVNKHEIIGDINTKSNIDALVMCFCLFVISALVYNKARR